MDSKECIAILRSYKKWSPEKTFDMQELYCALTFAINAVGKVEDLKASLGKQLEINGELLVENRNVERLKEDVDTGLRLNTQWRNRYYDMINENKALRKQVELSDDFRKHAISSLERLIQKYGGGSC